MRITPGGHALVMGLAKSGEAVARLLHQHGMSVVANDFREPRSPDPEVDALATLGIPVILGGHPLTLLDPRPDFIVKNPGIPYSVPLIQAALKQGIPVITEIEVALWLTRAPVYAITGSNGKTTTTTLVGEILTAANLRPVVAGNIGRVLSGVIEQVDPDQPLVLELSSFQLLGTESFHPRIGALLNLYPAHLDYHSTFEAYVDAKMNLFRNMNDGDLAILNYDSPEIRVRASAIAAPIVWFSRVARVEPGVFVQEGVITVCRQGESQAVLPVSGLALKGEHNLENALAATAIAIWADAPIAVVADALSRFRTVEHRLEFVREVAGVDYVNDSKATNPQAALQALKSVAGNVIWIAGGLDRGDDVSVLADLLAQKVKRAILLGQSAARLETLCTACNIPAEIVPSLDHAVTRAARQAEAGDTVLLSPACASWDMFTSFEERGRMFKDSVHRL